MRWFVEKQEGTSVRVRAFAIQGLWKMTLLLVVAVAAIVTLAQDAPSVDAVSGTSIILSKSNTTATPVQLPIILYPGGPSLTLYVWAKDVKDPQGAGRWQIEFNFEANLVSVSGVTPYVTWLQSTGRTADSCPPRLAGYVIQDPLTGYGNAQVSCITLDGPPPPFGPNCANFNCTGILASFTVTPRVVTPPQTARLNFQLDDSNPIFTYLTQLADTGVVSSGTVTEPQEIPATVPNASVLLAKCADMDGNGQVTVPGDILGVILRYNWTTATPGWDPKYDLNNDGRIDVPNDILGAIFQYNLYCTQTP